MNFKELGIIDVLLEAIKDEGYTNPTPIQIQAIPTLLEGNDLLGCAQTGTGKTAAFGVPILQRIYQKQAGNVGRRTIKALIVTPTRELAIQIGESFTAYGKYTGLNNTVIFGGVKQGSQTNALRRGVDILVATPGRLLDHMQRGTIRLGGVETLVLDEADRMLDMGFIHDIRKVMKALPSQRQNLLFSATFSKEISQLASDLLNSPMEIQIARRNTTAEQISQLVYPVDKSRKRELLSHLIGKGNWQQVLVFTRTKHMANRLTTQLERDGLSAAAIHGNKSQGARTRALADFKKGKTRVLVATDIAARGLDIELLPHVVNYELPNVPEDYIHRIGRTGRAGQEGQAVSLVCVDEKKLLADIERLLKRELEKVIVAGYEPDESIKAVPIKNGGGRNGGGRNGGNRKQSRGQRPGGRPGGRSNGRHGSDSHEGRGNSYRKRSKRAA